MERRSGVFAYLMVRASFLFPCDKNTLFVQFYIPRPPISINECLSDAIEGNTAVMTEKGRGDVDVVTDDSGNCCAGKPPLTKETVTDANDGFSKDVQAGVMGIEAAASVWTKSHLVLVYGM